jgi:hypothetical protein
MRSRERNDENERLLLAKSTTIGGTSMTGGTMTGGTFEVHSEARGPHWIAWLTQPGSTTPVQSAVLVGRTREEAETRARQWAETGAQG